MVAPNSDTLYTYGFFDLSGGPLVLTIPNGKGRFHVQQLLDAYSNIPVTIGTRAFFLAVIPFLQSLILWSDILKRSYCFVWNTAALQLSKFKLR